MIATPNAVDSGLSGVIIFLFKVVAKCLRNHLFTVMPPSIFNSSTSIPIFDKHDTISLV